MFLEYVLSVFSLLGHSIQNKQIICISYIKNLNGYCRSYLFMNKRKMIDLRIIYLSIKNYINDDKKFKFYLRICNFLFKIILRNRKAKLLLFIIKI